MSRAATFAVMLAVAPCAAAAQLDGGVAAEQARMRSGGGLRVLSLGTFGYSVAGLRASAGMAGSFARPLGAGLVGAEGAFLQGVGGRTAVAGNLALALTLGRTEVSVRAGGGAAPAERPGSSVAMAGVALARGGFRVSVTSNRLPGLPATSRDSIVSGPDTTLVFTILRPAVPSRVYADVEASYRVARGAFELEAALGHRVGADAAAAWWGRVGSAYRLSPWIAIGASFGRAPAVPWRNANGRTSTSLFLRFDAPRGAVLVPSDPERSRGVVESVRVIAADETAILVRSRVANTVEIAGDFTDWKPVALRRSGPGLWRASLRLPPGVYHLSVRVDNGPWTAPPGLPAVADGFGGETGVFEVGAGTR